MVRSGGGGGADKHVDSLLPLFAPRTINNQYTDCIVDTVLLLSFIIGRHFKGLTLKSTWLRTIGQCVMDHGPDFSLVFQIPTPKMTVVHDIMGNILFLYITSKMDMEFIFMKYCMNCTTKVFYIQ